MSYRSLHERREGLENFQNSFLKEEVEKEEEMEGIWGMGRRYRMAGWWRWYWWSTFPWSLHHFPYPCSSCTDVFPAKKKKKMHWRDAKCPSPCKNIFLDPLFNCFLSSWQWWSYPHWLRDLVSPVCGIFFKKLIVQHKNFKNVQSLYTARPVEKPLWDKTDSWGPRSPVTRHFALLPGLVQSLC